MYRDITFSDRNSIKRWLQRERLLTALRITRQFLPKAATICDYGAADGSLCRLLAQEAPHADIVCFEPTPELLNEARANLEDLTQVSIYGDAVQLPKSQIDLAYCLEVFEHLPPTETDSAMRTIAGILKPGGLLIVGVPVEIGVAALYKGIFRMTRRPGDFDTSMSNIFRAVLGRPPADRLRQEISPGLGYYFHHLGFDYRQLRAEFDRRSEFVFQAQAYSPFNVPGSLMPETYFVVRKL